MAEEGKITDDDDFDTDETEVEEGKITDDDDGDTPECEKKESPSDDIVIPPNENFDEKEWDWNVVENQPNIIDSENEKHKIEYAHEINLQLLKLILYRQERKFFLSAGLLFVMVGSVAGLLYMSLAGGAINDTVENLLLILLTATATTQAKLTDFWFNNSSDDTLLVQEATSYSMNGNGNGPGNSKKK